MPYHVQRHSLCTFNYVPIHYYVSVCMHTFCNNKILRGKSANLQMDNEICVLLPFCNSSVNYNTNLRRIMDWLKKSWISCLPKPIISYLKFNKVKFNICEFMGTKCYHVIVRKHMQVENNNYTNHLTPSV